MTSQASGYTMTTVARNIQAARAESGLTQRQVAEALGVDSMLISKWERARHRPNEQNLAALGHLFGHDLAWFYTEHQTDQVAA